MRGEERPDYWATDRDCRVAIAPNWCLPLSRVPRTLCLPLGHDHPERCACRWPTAAPRTPPDRRAPPAPPNGRPPAAAPPVPVVTRTRRRRGPRCAAPTRPPARAAATAPGRTVLPQHDGLRIQQVHRPRQSYTERGSGVAKGTSYLGIALGGTLGQQPDAVLPRRQPGRAQHGLLTRVLLEAAPTAARARRTLRAHRHMPQLARETPCSPQQPPVHEHCRTDADLRRHMQEVAWGGVAEPEFREAAEVGLVVHGQRQLPGSSAPRSVSCHSRLGARTTVRASRATRPGTATARPAGHSPSSSASATT